MNQDKEKILVVLPLSDAQKSTLESKAPGADFTYRDQKTVPREDVKKATIIIGNVKTDFLEDVPDLKWIHLDSAGSDQYAALPVFKEEKALLTNSSGSYGMIMSEYMVGAVVIMNVGFHKYRDQQAKHIWQKNPPPKSINGARTLIVGFGDIGSSFAEKMHSMGSAVTAIRRTDAPGPSYLKGLHTLKDLHALLPDADIVAVCLPNSEETRNIFDEKAFSLMKEGAFFINVGRGTTVDTDALASALQSGHLGAATVDVTNPEPLPQEHPLWDCENAIISPHIAGLDEQKDAFGKIVKLATANLEAFMQGKALKCVVDPETGYRKL